MRLLVTSCRFKAPPTRCAARGVGPWAAAALVLAVAAAGLAPTSAQAQALLTAPPLPGPEAGPASAPPLVDGSSGTPLAPEAAGQSSAPPGPVAVAVVPTAAGATTAAAPADAPKVEETPRSRILGLAFDLGVPDIAAVTLLVRPFPWLRLGASLLYNVVGLGARGSVSVQPLWVLAPSLNVEVGHYFEDGQGYDRLVTMPFLGPMLAQSLAAQPQLRAVLENFGYTFVNAQVGLELGAPNAFVLFIRAGISRIWITPHGLNQALPPADLGGQTITFSGADPTITLQVPTAKIGFLFYFW